MTSPFVAAAELLGERLQASISQAVETLGQRGAELARASPLFKGNALRKATQFHRVDWFQGFVLADKPYAFYVEEGNNQLGPRIYPRFAKALHFFIDGQEFFRKSVKAHGPLPFMGNARDQLEREATAIIEAEIAKAIR